MPFVGGRRDCKGAWLPADKARLLHALTLGLGSGLHRAPPLSPSQVHLSHLARLSRPHGPSLTISCQHPAGSGRPSAPGQSPGSVGGGQLPVGTGLGCTREPGSARGGGCGVRVGAFLSLAPVLTFPAPTNSPGLCGHGINWPCWWHLSSPSCVMPISKAWKLRPGCQMSFQAWSGIEQDSLGAGQVPFLPTAPPQPLCSQWG